MIRSGEEQRFKEACVQAVCEAWGLPFTNVQTLLNQQASLSSRMVRLKRIATNYVEYKTGSLPDWIDLTQSSEEILTSILGDEPSLALFKYDLGMVTEMQTMVKLSKKLDIVSKILDSSISAEEAMNMALIQMPVFDLMIRMFRINSPAPVPSDEPEPSVAVPTTPAPSAEAPTIPATKRTVTISSVEEEEKKRVRAAKPLSDYLVDVAITPGIIPDINITPRAEDELHWKTDTCQILVSGTLTEFQVTRTSKLINLIRAKYSGSSRPKLESLACSISLLRECGTVIQMMMNVDVKDLYVIFFHASDVSMNTGYRGVILDTKHHQAYLITRMHKIVDVLDLEIGCWLKPSKVIKLIKDKGSDPQFVVVEEGTPVKTDDVASTDDEQDEEEGA